MEGRKGRKADFVVVVPVGKIPVPLPLILIYLPYLPTVFCLGTCLAFVPHVPPECSAARRFTQSFTCSGVYILCLPLLLTVGSHTLGAQLQFYLPHTWRKEEEEEEVPQENLPTAWEEHTLPSLLFCLQTSPLCSPTIRRCLVCSFTTSDTVEGGIATMEGREGREVGELFIPRSVLEGRKATFRKEEFHHMPAFITPPTVLTYAVLLPPFYYSVFMIITGSACLGKFSFYIPSQILFPPEEVWDCSHCDVVHSLPRHTFLPCFCVLPFPCSIYIVWSDALLLPSLPFPRYLQEGVLPAMSLPDLVCHFIYYTFYLCILPAV